MPLLKTISDYFRKERKSIILSNYSWLGSDVIYLNRAINHKEGYKGLYWTLLHEFIHLDRGRTTGSYLGWASKDIPAFNPNLSQYKRRILQKIENQIEMEVGEMIIQNCLAYRFLKGELQKATITPKQQELPEFLQSLGA